MFYNIYEKKNIFWNYFCSRWKKNGIQNYEYIKSKIIRE